MGVFHFLTALTLSFSIYTSHPTTTFKMGISLASKSYFDCLKQRLCFFATFRNHTILSLSFILVLAGITIHLYSSLVFLHVKAL